MDIKALALNFLEHDVRQRVIAQAEGTLDQRLTRPIHPDFEGFQPYGEVSHLDYLPMVSVDRYDPREKLKSAATPLVSYGWQGAVRYFPFPETVSDPLRSSIFTHDRQSYRPTLTLLNAIWECLRSWTPRFPVVSGKTLVYWSNRRKHLDQLMDAGFHIQMAGYESREEILGVERLLTRGFVSEFAYPGEEPVVFSTLDAEVSILMRLSKGRQQSSSDRATVSMEDEQLLRELKEVCFKMQELRGTEYAKSIWSAYKSIARHIGSGELKRAS